MMNYMIMTGGLFLSMCCNANLLLYVQDMTCTRGVSVPLELEPTAKMGDLKHLIRDHFHKFPESDVQVFLGGQALPDNDDAALADSGMSMQSTIQFRAELNRELYAPLKMRLTNLNEVNATKYEFGVAIAKQQTGSNEMDVIKDKIRSFLMQQNEKHIDPFTPVAITIARSGRAAAAARPAHAVNTGVAKFVPVPSAVPPEMFVYHRTVSQRLAADSVRSERVPMNATRADTTTPAPSVRSANPLPTGAPVPMTNETTLMPTVFPAYPDYREARFLHRSIDAMFEIRRRLAFEDDDLYVPAQHGLQQTYFGMVPFIYVGNFTVVQEVFDCLQHTPQPHLSAIQIYETSGHVGMNAGILAELQLTEEFGFRIKSD